MRVRATVVALVLLLAASGPSAWAAPAPVPKPVPTHADPRDLLARSEQVSLSDPRESARLAGEALLRLRGPDDGALRTQALARLCIATAVFDPKAALPIGDRGLAEARERGDSAIQSRLAHCQGYAQEQLGDMDAAARAYEQAVFLAQDAADSSALSLALASRGEIRHNRGEYDVAIVDLKQAYDLAVETGEGGRQRYILNAIANLYADGNVRQYDQAIDTFRRLLAANEAEGLPAAIATSHFNLGSTLERMERFDEALLHYRKAYDIDRKLGDADSVAEEQRAIGALLARQDKPGESLPWIEPALAHFQAQADEDGVARCRLSRGIALRKLGRHEAAIADLDAARDYFQPLGNLRFLARIHEERALAFAAAGDWRPAYEASAEQRSVQQALDQRLAEERSARLRVQFGADRKEEENRNLLQENTIRGQALANAEQARKLQLQVIILGIVLLVVVAVLALRQLLKARRLRVLALTDELTRLPNRRHILAFLDDQVHSARKLGQPLSLISFDIDFFKRVNDNYGHDAGDVVLHAVATAAKEALRRSDRVGRVGGEEFLAVLPATSRAVALEIAERMRRMVENTPLDQVAPGLRVTISLGVSEWSGGQDATPSVVKRADEALYVAKHGGRNQVVAG